MKKYHLSKDIVHYYVKRYKITKVKKKKCIYFRKEEFDRLMENVFQKTIYYQLLLISTIYFLFTEVNIVSFRNLHQKQIIIKQYASM